MRIHACYSDSHRPLLERHFLPSIPAECDVVLRRIGQKCPTGVFRTGGWAEAMVEKIHFIKESFLDGREPFIYSDVDIRFYGDVAKDALACLGDADLAIQDDGGALCSGFFIVRPGRLTYRLFIRTLEIVPKHGCDQPALNAAIVEMGRKLRVVVLPNRYWTAGRTDGEWSEGKDVNPPADLIMHHGNYAVGIERKMALLSLVEGKKASKA